MSGLSTWESFCARSRLPLTSCRPVGQSTAASSPPQRTANTPSRQHPCLETSAIPQQATAPIAGMRALARCGEWSLGSLHSRLAICFWKSARNWPVAVSQMSLAARPPPGGNTVSIDQTQRLRCVARSARPVASTCAVFGRRIPSELSQVRCHQIAASLPSIHGHGCHASFRGGLFAAAAAMLHLPGCLQITGFTHNRLCGVKILHVAASSPTVFSFRLFVMSPAVFAGFAFDTEDNDISVPR